jgi:hypothetical protein
MKESQPVPAASQKPASPTSTLSTGDVIGMYFLEHRAKLLDIAAYLDRIDRASGPRDFRDEAFREAIQILASSEPHRAKRILELLSDMSQSLPQSAEGMKGALGATPLPPES